MAFIQKLRHYLGFDDENDEIFADSDEDTATGTTSATASDTGHTEDYAPRNDENLTADIFTAVVNLFNESLPPFLKETVDTDAQKRYIYDSLDSSLKQRLAEAESQAARRAETRFSSEHTTLRNEIDTLKTKSHDLEQKNADIRQQQLSADRQKRALSDRVHDLESQIAALEAEREQYDLENKSLLNKIKAAGVVENDTERLRAEVDSLRRQLKESPAGSDTAGLEKLTAENAALTEALDTLKAKQDIADAMVEDMRKKTADLRKELEEKEQLLAAANKKADEAERLRAEFTAVEQQMSLIEEVIAKRDKKIESQKQSIEVLETEAASLRDTIARNLALQAETEDTLRRRIAELEASPTTPVVLGDIDSGSDDLSAGDDLVSPKISDTDLIEIEESFSLGPVIETTDTTRIVAARTARESESDETRNSRRRRHDNDNDAQMSLF